MDNETTTPVRIVRLSCGSDQSLVDYLQGPGTEPDVLAEATDCNLTFTTGGNHEFSADIGGMLLWRLGGEDPDIYPALARWKKPVAARVRSDTAG